MCVYICVCFPNKEYMHKRRGLKLMHAGQINRTKLLLSPYGGMYSR